MHYFTSTLLHPKSKILAVSFQPCFIVNKANRTILVIQNISLLNFVRAVFKPFENMKGFKKEVVLKFCVVYTVGYNDII